MKSRTLRIAPLVLATVPAVAVLVAVFALWRGFRPAPRDIPVLMYHNVLDGENLSKWQVSADEFAAQMDRLADAGYETILPHDIARASRGWGRLPPKPVVITFDDGYEGVKTFAEPILARHGFRAICYVIVNRLGGEGADRAAFDSGPLLSTNEVAAMAARGTVAFGSHSLSHIPVPVRLSTEIRQSRYRLRELTGVKTHDYCYPFGLHGYDHMYAALRESHYETAMICDDRMFRFGADTNLFAIPRLSVYGGRHAVGLAAEDPVGGTVTITNGGMPLPLKAVIRRESDGRTWETEPQWAGGRGVPVYRFPPDAFEEPHRVEAWDKAGLFRYL